MRCHMLAPKLMALLNSKGGVVYQLATGYYTEFQTPMFCVLNRVSLLHDGGSSGCRIYFCRTL